MGIISENFNEKIKEIWKIANQLDKPINNNLSWTFGIIKGRTDFEDLQAQGAALMSSIIINEKTVPKIICGWDVPTDTRSIRRDPERKFQLFPKYLLNLFEDFNLDFLKVPEPIKLKIDHVSNSYNYLSNKYVSLHRSGLSVNPTVSMLGLGYRAKYHGLNYVRTPYAIMSDIDTVCTNECTDYIQEEINKNTETFCLTNYYDDSNVSVGLVVFNMKKYREIYLPLWYENFWRLPHADSKFIQTIRKKFPEHAEELDLRLMDRNIINTEKYYKDIHRKNVWVDNKSAHYHAWKGEIRSNPEKFLNFYDKILTDLLQKGKEQNDN